MSSTTKYEINAVADAREETTFFKCPVGGYASLHPGICPKCGELLMAVGVSPASTGNCREVRLPGAAQTLAKNQEAGVAG